jgi:broad-specificity NMP kinase
VVGVPYASSVPSRSWIVHLIGFPGVGKLTVATELAHQASTDPDHRMVVVDNHLTGNPILALLQLDGRGAPAPEVWPYVEEIRAVVHRAIPALTPPGWSFVFTNVILVDDPLGHAGAVALRRLAAARDSTYVPVVLRCEPGELLRRAASPGRAENHKWVDTEAIARWLESETQWVPDDAHLLELDTTRLTPAEVAASIRRHLDAVDASTTFS